MDRSDSGSNSSSGSGIKAGPLSEARVFFADELKVAFEKRNLQANPDSFEYLVNLLVGYMESKNFFQQDEQGRLQENFLLGMYGDYLTGDAQVKRITLRRLGDVCLLITGFFPDSLNRKLVDLDYYFGMGGSAYHHLSKLQLHELAGSLFQELSVKFRAFSDILGEMSTRTGLQTNADLLRLYEKWLHTKSQRLKKLLGEHGITPLHVDTKSRH